MIPAERFEGSNLRIAHDLEAYEPRGCARCNNSGYKGRVGLYEAMLVTDAIRSLVIERAPADKIRDLAMHEGMRPLDQDGIDKVRAGLTSVEEVARVTGSGTPAE